MDFTIEEYNEEINLTIIEDGDTLEFSIEEVVEEVNITIEEYNGADGIGLKGDKPDHEWNGTQLRFENPDDTWGEYVDLKGDGGGIMSIQQGANITIDNTDPLNPIISAEEGGTTVTKTSDLTNDGADGINPFITANDIPDVTPQVNADWNATSGVAEILNKPTIPAPVDLSIYATTANLTTETTNRTTADDLKLDKPLAPDNIAERVINADGSTSPKGNFSRTLQVEVATNATAQEDWKGKLILITASCTITIPATLSDSWGIELATLAGVTLTLAITTPKTWLFGTPSTIGEKTVCTIAQRGNTNSIALFGL